MGKKKTLLPAAASAAVALALGLFLGQALWAAPSNTSTPLTPQAQYLLAVEDAAFARPDEIQPLVTLTQGSPLTLWDEKGRVAVASWHDAPQYYPAGETVSMGKSIWTFTLSEFTQWYSEHSAEVDESGDLRLKQLIGLPPESDYTHFSVIWADPADFIRPAVQTDITSQITVTDLAVGETSEYADWYRGNLLNSYYPPAYPWTRLGYTYDWADLTQPYGLSEFLLCEGAEVEIADTQTTADFLAGLAAAD